MREVTFSNPVLKIKGLEVKFDTIPVSSSLDILLGNRYLASIVQQLHYWGLQGYGEVIDGVRWIYKPIKEWIAEVFPTLSYWQLSKLMGQLVEMGIIRREKLFTQHQIQVGERFWWQPKNQTYYYSLNTEKIQELADNFDKQDICTNTPPAASDVPLESAKPPKNPVFAKTQILSNEENQDTKFSDCAKFNTKNTSKENISKDQSHPTLPSEWDNLKPINQDQDSLNTSELSATSQESKNSGGNREVIKKEISSAHVDNKVNQNKGTVQDDVRVDDDTATRSETANTSDTKTVNSAVSKPKPKVSQETKTKRSKKAPWKDEEQFKRFYGELVKALPIVANSHSPQGLAQTIIRQLRCGTPHSYWDDFAAGVPIGTSTKPEWEIAPGEPYPMFVEYLTEKIKRGDNTTSDEQTRNEVFRILSKPRQAKAFWGQFKRSVVNVSQRIESDRALGVSNPNTPVWTRERIEPTISEAAAAGEKIMATNHTASTAIAAGAGNPNKTSKHLVLEEQKPENQKHLENSDRECALSAVREISDPWRDENEDKLQSPTDSVSDTGDKSSNIKHHESLSLSEMLSQKLGSKNLKGFTKQMPKVSQEEAETEFRNETEAASKQRLNRKTHIDRMSVKEINQLLTDSIMRRELTPQIITNGKFDVVTDNLGEILAVKINREYLKNGGT